MTRLPPGPSGAVLQSLKHAKDPYSLFPGLREKYGDPFTLPHVLGPLVVTGDPKGVEQILAADPAHYQVYAPDAVIPLAGPASVSVVNGEDHQRKRRVIMPSFMGERMRAYGQIIADVTRRNAARWEVGHSFHMHTVTINISAEVMVRTVMGLTDPEEVAKCRDVIERFVGAFTPPIVIMKWMRREFFGVGPWANFMRVYRELDEVLYGHIKARRASGEHGTGILGLLLDTKYEDGATLPDNEIRDQLVTLMFAGHETTGAAMAWAFHWLYRTPEALERLLAELEPLGADPDPSELAQLPYLNAVCHEALRLHPTVPDVFRDLVRPMEVMGYALEPGVALDASVILLHLNEAVYPEARRFRPERFLERKYGPFEYIPFGGGARRCLGATFAVYEMKVSLGTILNGARLRPADAAEHPGARHGLVMVPSGGVELVLEERRALPSRKRNVPVAHLDREVAGTPSAS